MQSGLEVVAHPTGPWLVRAGRVVWAVPANLARALLRWQGRRPSRADLAGGPVPAGTDAQQWLAFVTSVAAALESGDTSSGRTPPAVWLRVPLLPARLVRRLARALAPLTGRRALLGLLLMGGVGYFQLGRATAAAPISPAPGSLPAILGLFLVTAVWHELGHAAALARHGYPPGGIGAGLLFVIPVLFADVTAVGVLPRRGRLRVDLAGAVFQFGLGGVLAGAALAGFPAAAPAAGLALVAVVWSLFPFIRADGYWVVCDLIGVPDLESIPVSPPRRRVRIFLALFRATNALFLLLIGFGLPLRYAHRADDLLAHWGRQDLRLPVYGLGLVVLALVWRNLLRRVGRLLRPRRSARRDPGCAIRPER